LALNSLWLLNTYIHPHDEPIPHYEKSKRLLFSAIKTIDLRSSRPENPPASFLASTRVDEYEFTTGGLHMEKALRDAISENQVYLGVQLSDLQAFDRYCAPEAIPETGFYTDFSGVRTRLSYFGIDSHPAEHAVGAIPFPDDALHAEAIEYLAAVYALEQAGDSFTVVELGAGYGPWLVFGAKAALRRGITKVRLIAVEADLQRHQLFYTNLADNGLHPPSSGVTDVDVRCVHGAISDVNVKVVLWLPERARLGRFSYRGRWQQGLPRHHC
jgi:hypothetical protein